MKAHHRDGERLLGEAIRLLMFGKAIEACYWLCNSELKPMKNVLSPEKHFFNK
jgi:hypothetical protein